MGDEVGYVSPLYLILDGLKRIDTNFESSEHKAKHEAWLQARSEIVDLFLTVEQVDGKARLKDRVGYAVFLRTLDFLQERWKGVWPILYGDQLRQARLDDWIFQGLLDVEHLPS